MMLMIFVLLLLSMTNAQEYIEDSEYDEANNVSCISKYRDLEAYVLNNKDLMDNLTETFFKTGKTSTEFVKIAYRFMVLQSFRDQVPVRTLRRHEMTSSWKTRSRHSITCFFNNYNNAYLSA